MCNDKMNKDEILKAIAHIGASLYSLRKANELDTSAYYKFTDLVNTFYDDFSWEILLNDARNEFGNE